MAKKRKTTKKPSTSKTQRLWTWIRPVFYFGLGAFVGLFVPWYAYINHVTNTIIHEQWEVPSAVFARPLELFDGQNISSAALTFELDLLGYRQVSGQPQVGQYQKQGNRFRIHSKGFRFADQRSPAQAIELSIHQGVVSAIKPQMARLEPAVIGHFFSSAFENRNPIALAAIPTTLVQGIQAVEDREFKHHSGVDWWGVMRAAVKNVMAGKIVQGGSTLTQQLVKNKLSYDQQTWLRKLHEAMAAIQLARKLSKKDILQMYFNEVFFGQDGKVAIHGVVEAAGFYFAKPVSQLNIHEQALLVGILKGPSWYNPIRNPDRALNRRNVVLNVWHETGIINQQTWQQAKKQPLGLSQHRQLKTDHDDYMAVVKKQIKSQFSDRDLKQKGLRIFTHLDPFIQRKTNQTARRTRHWLDQNMESAIVVSDAQSGALLALSGSQSAHSGFNRALLARRPIGSLIKPFVYLAGLDSLSGFDLDDTLKDEPVSVTLDDGSTWDPKNWDGSSSGRISAFDALVRSRNQATVDLGLKMGLPALVDYLQQLGLSINRANHPSLFLGAIELTPFEVQHLFSLLSSQGQISQINAIMHVTDANNRILTRSRPQPAPKLNLNDLKTINQALHQVTTTGTAQKITNKYQLPRRFHGKTGTTNGGRDSWFSGYDQHILATVWVGRDDNQPTPYSGGSGALVLWANLMRNLE